MKVQRLGILGGGQLARMLALAAHPLGIEPLILAGSATDPAAQVAPHKIGALDVKVALNAFVRKVDALTFESEFVNTAQVAASLKGLKIKAYPSLEILSRIQDRLSQKTMLDQFKIATSPWMKVSTEEDLNEAHRRFPKGFVLKQRRFGYDGYGTFIIKTKNDVRASLLQASEHGFIAERLISFRRELAISFVRSRTGEFLALPLVESVQQNARCFSVKGPIEHAALKKIERAFKHFMVTCDYVGILAVELFEGPEGLLVNELAPRVHNSAHYSQNALACDQFEYHLRAVLGLPLPKVTLLRPAFAMVNLLGEGHAQVQLSPSAVGHLHWYGKSENRAGRKLGHINVLDRTPSSALRRALAWRKEFVL